MDVVRDLLLEIEAAPAENPWKAQLSRKDPDEVTRIRHLELLDQQGLVVVGNRSHMHGGTELWIDVNLTWPGHEFVDSVRSDTVWRKTKEHVATTVGTASLAVVSEVAKGVARALLGLP